MRLISEKGLMNDLAIEQICSFENLYDHLKTRAGIQIMIDYIANTNP